MKRSAARADAVDSAMGRRPRRRCTATIDHAAGAPPPRKSAIRAINPVYWGIMRKINGATAVRKSPKKDDIPIALSIISPYLKRLEKPMGISLRVDSRPKAETRDTHA
jgi:hypothetical protein